MYIETMQQIMTSTTKVLLDAKSGGNLLFLPLDKIMQMTAGAMPEIVSPSKQTLVDPTPLPESTPARSRDALRSREREGRQ
jgi:modulator of FtsH protease HflK